MTGSHRPGSPRRPLSLRGAKVGAACGVAIAILLTVLITILNGRAAPVFLLGMLFLLTPLGAFLGAVLTGIGRHGTDDGGEEASRPSEE